ncbi:MAG: FAD-binding oxidoreductase, partial [Flavobacterium sp.]
MKLRSIETFWPLKHAMDMSYPSLDSDLETEILIIGGGITGALMAYKLINEGKKVVMVDRRDIANGSTAASTALLQYEIDVSLHELVKLRGVECAVDSYRNGKKAIFDMRAIVDDIKSDCQFEFKKSIYFCSLKKDLPFLKAEFKCRKESGFDVTWLEKWDLEKLGLNALAAIESKTAAVVDPYRLTYDLVKYCEDRGMQIFDRTNIISVQEHKDKLVAYTEDKCKITVDHVVNCSGYESTETLKEKVVDLKSTYAIASECLPDLPKAFKNAIFWDTSNPYLYFRGTQDNRIIMGGGDEEFKDAKKRDKLLPKKEQFLLKKFQRK